MAKLTLADGTVFEGTTEEIFAITERFGGKQADKPAETITHNGVEYTLVDRKAQEGDVVVFTASSSSCVTNGKVYGPIFNVTGSERLKAYGNDGDRVNVFNGGMNRTEENTLVYAPKVVPLKVGDYAVVIAKGIGQAKYEFVVGDVVTVENTHDPLGNSLRPLVRKLSGDRAWFMSVGYEIRKATDEEVSKAKAEQAQAEKNAIFTRLGRKPNEYKKGDIVRITEYQFGHTAGSFVEVVSDDNEDGVVVKGESFGEIKTHSADLNCVELIAPVESRVDRQ